MIRIHFIGGMCGTTMLRAAELIEERCRKDGVSVKTTIQNVWEYPDVDFSRIDILIQMMPLYEEDTKVKIFNGKPFISHIGEKALIELINDEVLGRSKNDLL